MSPYQMAMRLEWCERGESRGFPGRELFAEVPVLEHSVGPAGYTILPEVWGDGHEVTWWHGNRGHNIGCAPTEVEAKDLAQAHLDTLVRALLAELPEDGVIVERGEWERMERDHRAMETLRPNLAPRFAWIFDGFDLKQGSKSMGYADPAAAILGTEPSAPRTYIVDMNVTQSVGDTLYASAPQEGASDEQE